MKKKILFTILLLLESLFGQTKLINEKIEKNKLILRYSVSINSFIKKENGRNIFYVADFQDESKPGDVSLPSNDIFISLPKAENPLVKFSIDSKKNINAIPRFNKRVELDERKEVVYSDPKVLNNSKNSHFKIKGFLWINGSYSLQVEVTPAIFIPSQNIIEVVEKYSVELLFNEEIVVPNILKRKTNVIFSNTDYKIEGTIIKYKITESDSWIDYTKEYLKIGTAKDGIYRINKTDLEKEGINTAGINPKSFRLYLEGKEIPIFVKGEDDFSFDTNDYIEFAGIRNMGGHHRELSGYDEPYNEYLGRYTDTTVYWLTWDGIEGKRVEISDGSEITSLDTLDYYSQIEHFEKNNWFDFSCASLVRRESPYWIENKTWHEGNLNVGVRNKEFPVSEVYPDKEVKLFVKLQDYASNISNNAHKITLGINSGNWGDTTYFSKYQKIVLTHQVNSNLLNDDINTLNIKSLSTNASLNVCIFDWYEVEYPRYLIPFNDSLNFIFPFLDGKVATTIKIRDITANSYSIWKYGEEYKKYNVDKVGDKIIFADSVSGNDKFVFIDESKILTPKIYYKKQFTNLRSTENKADYIAITHKKFRDKVDEYAQFISDSYNLETKVIDIDDIYDEFGYGFFNPEVIKDFLKSTHNYWQTPKPSGVVLIGGATYDYYGNKYKNIASVTERVCNYVPSFGAPVSDNWFVTWDTTGAYIPQMNIGRIPVTTNEELQWYFEKHRNYVSQEYDEWNKNYLFFSGGNPTKPSELNSMREANEFVIDNYVIPKPTGGNASHFYKTIDPATNFGPYTPDYIQGAIDDGAVYISYIGHSGTQTWDNSITNPSQLKNNKNRYPVVSDFGCSTGRFAEPDVVSFSQLFTLDPEGQAIGYIGNSSLGFVSTSLLMPKLFYKKILKENIYTVSEAHKEAKIEMLQTYGSTGIYELFSLTNTLIGDPIITLPIPKRANFVIESSGIELSSTLLTDLQDSANISIRYNNYGRAENDTLEVLIIHQFELEEDSILIKREIPSFVDSVKVGVPIKSRAGNHSVKIILDPFNKYEEISKDDNRATLQFNVASSSIRPLFNTQILNGVKKKIRFINPTSKPVNEQIIIDISSDSNFDNPKSYEIFFDSLFSIYSIGELDIGKRFWCRTKIKGDNNYTTTFSFTVDGEKYYLFDSLGFSKSYNEGVFIKNNRISVDTSEIVFEVFSAGFNDGNTAYVVRNGVNYIPESTIPGHHVTLFNISPPYEFVEYHYFNTLAGGNEITKYNTLLDTLSDNYLVAIAVSDEGTPRDATLKANIRSLGSVLIDKVGWRASWAFIGYKGATPGTMPEAYSPSGEGPVTIDTTISFLSEKGSMLTTEIGPTGKWDKLVVSQELPSNSAITYTPIGIKEDGTLDTLAELALQDTVADLSFINSELYPKMQILADFSVSDDKQSPVLKSFGVDYADVAELALNYQVVSVEHDSITQNENNKLFFTIYNVGETDADSVSVKIELHKPDNSSVVLDRFTASIDSSDKKRFEFDYKIAESYGYGDMAFSVTLDEDEKINEFYKDNNIFRIPFYVKKDTVTNINSAEIDVRFDGFEIMDGDFVTNTPELLFGLNYSGNFPLSDTSAVLFSIDNKRVYYNQMNVDYDTVNKTITYSYNANFDDGSHYLRVRGNHLLIDDSFGIEKLFTVSNELKAVDIYNFPNPASDETDFTFRLAKLPESLDIKIYTVAGRLIKNFELQSYDLKADINRIHWDLTDEDGDKIANGVYLYKIILRGEDKVEYYTNKLAVVR